MFRTTILIAFLIAGTFAIELTEDQYKDQATGALRTLCKKNNAEDKAQGAIDAGSAFVDCMKGLVNSTVIQQEINDAKKVGALDEVFKKYCAKTPELKTCIHTLLDGVSPCLDEKTKEQVVPAKNGTDQLIDFVCHKDGDRIALFIAEGGPECIRAKFTDVKSCADTVKESVPDVETAKHLTTAEKCAKFDTLASCIVTKLETCSTPTPGNMAESLFRYVRKGSPCNTALPPP